MYIAEIKNTVAVVAKRRDVFVVCGEDLDPVVSDLGDIDVVVFVEADDCRRLQLARR